MLDSIQLVDMVIPAAPKDYSKLPYVIDAVRNYIGVRQIHIITPDHPGFEWNHVTWHHDEDVLPYDRTLIKHRPNWIYQMLLKMLQDVTQSDWFMVIDADIIINRHINLWTKDGIPILNLGRNQYCKPYFEFNKQILGYGRVFDWSFLSECTLYNKFMVRKMIPDMDMFWDKLVHIINDKCHIGDAELYGSFIMHEYPGLYELQHLNAVYRGKHNEHVWTDREIRSALQSIRSFFPDAHLISLHSWE